MHFMGPFPSPENRIMQGPGVYYNMFSNDFNDLSHSHSPQYDFMPGQGAQIYDSQRTILQLRKEVKIKVH